jgi:hypothetical protein
MSNNTPSFTHKKRIFLLNKLDEVIKIWASGSGQGSFSFTVENGTSSLQYGLQLEMQDVGGAEPAHVPHEPVAHGHRRRHRGPARKARDRQRAARHQATLAAAKTEPKFPGCGQAVGSAAKPVLSIPLNKGDFFPSMVKVTPPSPPPSVATTVSSTVTTSLGTTTSSTSLSSPMNLANTSLLSPAMGPVRDEILSESEEEDVLTPRTQLLLKCGYCKQPFSSSSGPVYCPHCATWCHTECGKTHNCQATFKF